VQSQEYGQAKWAVGQRVAGATDALVERALDRGAIVRTHILRPTWHFVTPADIRWLLRLTAPRIEAQNAYRYRQLELDDSTLAEGRETIAASLRDDRHLTRRELAGALDAAGIDPGGQRLAYLVMHAELAGLICSGPRRGKQHTYALLDERAPGPEGPSGDEALAELAVRYFESHGPATAHDLAWWSGLRVTDVRAAIAIAEDRLESVEVGDLTYWSAAGTVDVSPVAGALLIPDFDESFVGYRDLRAKPRGRPADATLLSRPVLVDGERVARWRWNIGPKRVRLDVESLDSLARDDVAAIEAAAQRYEAFVEAPVMLTIA
jgi:Winged helix DNA-binding domain